MLLYCIIKLVLSVACLLYGVNADDVNADGSATLISMTSSSGKQCSTLTVGSSVNVSVVITLPKSIRLWVFLWNFNDTSVGGIHINDSFYLTTNIYPTSLSSKISISVSQASLPNGNTSFTSSLILSQLNASFNGIRFTGGVRSVLFRSSPLNISTCQASQVGVRTNCTDANPCVYNSFAELSCANSSSSISTHCGACTEFINTLDCSQVAGCNSSCYVPVIIIVLLWIVMMVLIIFWFHKNHTTEGFPTWYTWTTCTNRVFVVLSIIGFPIGLCIMIWWECCSKGSNKD